MMNFKKMVEHMSADPITKVYCPRCGRKTMDPDGIQNSLSRVADIEICNECGTAEAILDWIRPGANQDGLSAWSCLFDGFGKENEDEAL